MGRIHQLDSLRGLAALTVVMLHVLITFPAFYQHADNLPWLFTHTPLRALWAGTEAVYFFFLLSGFVLALPFLKNEKPRYSSYLIKRICRISIPYCVAIFFAVIAKEMFYTGQIPALSGWFNRVWSQPTEPGMLLDHLWLIGNFKNGQLIPVVWSLVHEMRVSLIFPAIMYFVNAWHWRAALLTGYSIAAGGTILTVLLSRKGIQQDYTETLTFIPFFVVGALIAKHKERLVAQFRKIDSRKKAVLAVLALYLYTFKWSIFPEVAWLHRWALAESTIIMAGMIVFVLLALSSSTASTLLNRRGVVLLGEISYSLYLIHAVCLVAFVHLFHQWLPVSAALIAAATVSLIFAYIGYIYIEKPAIALGKQLAGRKPILSSGPLFREPAP